MSGSWQNHEDVVLDPSRTILKNIIGGETGGRMGAESGRYNAKRRRRLCAAIQHNGMGRSTTRDETLLASILSNLMHIS